MILLSIGDQVEPGTYELHSRFDRVVNFTKGQDLVALVDEEIGPGPLNIVIRGLSSQERRVFSPWLRVSSNVVAFDNRRFSFSADNYYHSDFRPRGWDRKRFSRNLAFWGKLLVETSPARSLAFLLDERRIGSFRPGFGRAFMSRISQGVHQVFHNDLLGGIEILKGCGLGLTPSGDDFIAGLLIGVNLLQKLHHRNFRNIINAVLKTAVGDNLFSNAFLALAGRGLLFGRMKDLIEALTYEGENSIRASSEKLLAVGASSGADLGTGFFMTVLRGRGMMAQWAEAVRSGRSHCHEWRLNKSDRNHLVVPANKMFKSRRGGAGKPRA
ncbi:MAG: DUF2877 domain-containing protein [Acidobacteriota bacterium]